MTNDVDMFGFEEVAKGLQIRLKSGGAALLGEVIRPNQQAYFDLVRRRRDARVPVQFIWLKCRQFAAMSTTVGALLAADTTLNEGFNSIVTAQDANSLDEISQLYRWFFGRNKKDSVEQGKASRLADRLFVAPNGSRIKLQVASDDLGRSGSITGLHVSEAGYIEDWTEAWRSVSPALSDAWWRVIVMETTLKRNQPGDFRDFIDEADRGQYPPWEVHFTSWHANPHLRVEMSHKEAVEFEEICPPYERELHDKHGLDWGQVRWYFNTRIGMMLGSYDAMKEAFPTTKAEALTSASARDFFKKESMRFYRDGVKDGRRPPIKRMKMTHGGLRAFEDGDSPLMPHLEIWELPMAGGDYNAGADCADSDDRMEPEGSENALVVNDRARGRVVGVYHGYSNSYEFANLIDATCRMYGAQLVPEHNNAGKAVIDRLRTALGFTDIYKRETFKYGVAVGTMDGIYGFDTRGQTRGILIDRLQMGVDERRWDIPSEYLVGCLEAIAKNKGKRTNKRGDPSVVADDGAIALALTGFGHDNLVNKVWEPKAPYTDEFVPEPPKPRRSGIRIMQDAARGPTWDPAWQKWR